MCLPISEKFSKTIVDEIDSIFACFRAGKDVFWFYVPVHYVSAMENPQFCDHLMSDN